MGCSTSQAAKVVSAETKDNGLNEKAEGDRKYPPGEAFEVPLNEPDSIIKKHPPKRLQRLVDAPSTETTIEELEEKLANAEIRRNQFLTERVNMLKAKDDENIVNDDEKSNEIPINDEINTETQTADKDEPATEVVSSSTTNNETQLND